MMPLSIRELVSGLKDSAVTKKARTHQVLAALIPCCRSDRFSVVGEQGDSCSILNIDDFDEQIADRQTKPLYSEWAEKTDSLQTATRSPCLSTLTQRIGTPDDRVTKPSNSFAG
jgi:hypothetical protein